MIFSEPLLAKVLDGSKTVTRRPVKYDRIYDWPGSPMYSRVARVCKYKVGRTYAVQPVIEDGPGKGRGGKEVGRIRILGVRRGLLAGVDAAEAHREGFPNVAAFLRYWRGLYGNVDMSQPVDRIEFELETGEGKP